MSQNIVNYGQKLESVLSNAVNIGLGEGKASVGGKGKYMIVRSHHSLNGEVVMDVMLGDGKGTLGVAGITASQKVYSDYASYLIGVVKTAFPNLVWYEAIAELSADNGKLRTVQREAIKELGLSKKDRKTLLSLANDALKAELFHVAQPSSKATIVDHRATHTTEHYAKATAQDVSVEGSPKVKKGKSSKPRTEQEQKIASLRGHLQLAKNSKQQLLALGAQCPDVLQAKIDQLEAEIAALKEVK